MIVWLGAGRGNETTLHRFGFRRVLRNAMGRHDPRSIFALTDVPDSCYRRGGLRTTTPRRSDYGDQGEEVAWEIRQERFIKKREQEEVQEYKLTRQVCGWCDEHT